MDALRLAQFLKKAPKEPGVYTWSSRAGRPLYIGKAVSLKSRLANYPKSTDSRIQIMIAKAHSVTWQTTATEIEALILESQLIKSEKPTYNIVMRDDKQYFFVAVTKEDFPQLALTHQAQSSKIKKPIARLIGPFTDGLPLKTTLRTLRNIFPTCSCKQKHHVRCLNAHIGKCPGYCCLRTVATAAQKKEYAQHIRAITDILTGKRDSLIARMHKQGHDVGPIIRVFQNAQINARHQRTATLHAGGIQQIQEVFGLTHIPTRIEGYDIANIQGQHATGSMVVFTDGRADNQEYRKFTIKTVTGANDTAMLREVLERRLGHPEWRLPDLILVDGGKGQLNAVVKTLKAIELDIPVISLTKNDRHQGDHLLASTDTQVRYLKDFPRPVRDLVVHIDSEAHRFAIAHYRQRHRRGLVEK